MIRQSEPYPPEPDLAILVVAATRAVADRLQEAVTRAGYPETRPPFGFVIRALAEAGLTLTELAERLGVTKQAAIKVVDEMEAYGFVERRPDPGDRRSKILSLTERGRGVRRAALATSHRIEDELRRDQGNADVDAARRVLMRFVESSGGLDEVHAGRARPVW
jgi:DNA-binding MarR family transcriptional regulator